MTVALHTRCVPFSRWTPAQWGFAAIAIALHVSLLLLPLRTDVRTPRPGALELELFRAGKKAPPSEASRETVIPGPAIPADAITDPAAAAEPEVPGTETVPGPVISAAVLRFQLESLRLPPVSAGSRRLGVPRVQALPEHWTRPLLPELSGPFEEMFAPAEAEVLDQWQDPGGARRVVIRTPGGHTLCGRLEPWDPLNPLYEPVPMFHLCGGGGRR